MTPVDQTSPPGAPESLDGGKLLSSARLKTALSLFVVCLLAFVTGLTFLLVSRMFDGFDATVRGHLETEARNGARLIGQSADLAMAIGDEAMTRESFRGYRNNPNVLAIIAENSTGEVVRHGPALGPERVRRLFAIRERSLGADEESVWSWTTASIEGRVVGKVVLVISLRQLAESARLRQMILGISGMGCVLALLISLLFVNRYIAPLLRFTERTLTSLKELNETLETRVNERTVELQASLDALKAAQRDLADASRRAGMADIATTVLHNVGNVLNSVNVACNLVSDHLRHSSIEMMPRLVELLRTNQAELGPFFTANPKGRKFVDVLTKLGDAVTQQQGAALTELGQVQKNVDHIKIIVARQQSQAKVVVGAVETVIIEDLLEDAIQLNRVGGPGEIEFVRELSALPTVQVDRHKLFQILMNLLSNARHAVVDGGQHRARRIVVRTLPAGADNFRVEIEDSGCGIPAENLARIFTYGFTTKANGHGFGLHSASCAAIEMGGSLTAESAGPERGARFILDLPLQFCAPAAEPRAAA